MNKNIAPCAAAPVSVDPDRTGGSSAGGVILCLLSASLFAVSILTSKFVYQHGVGPYFFSFVRAVFCLVICAGFIAVRDGVWLMPKPSRRYVLPMAVTLFMVSFGYPIAMQYLPAGLATLLFYLWPMLVLVFSSIQHRELPGIRRFTIFLIAFIGLGFVFGPSVDNVQWEGVAAAMVAALGASLFFIVIPKATEHADSMTINVHINILVAIVFAVCAYIYEDMQMPAEAVGWYALAWSGLSYGLAMVLIFYAVSRTGPVTSSILFNTEPLIVTILAAVLFADILDPVQYLGIIAVVAAMMFASARTAKS